MINKDELGKTVYGVIGGIITAIILWLFSHLGNILNLSNGDKKTSYLIIFGFLSLLIFLWTIILWINKSKIIMRYLFLFLSVLIIALFSFKAIKGSKSYTPSYVVKFINTRDTTITIYSKGEIWIVKPTSPVNQIEYHFGYFDMSQNKIITNIVLAPKDSAFATLNFRSKNSLTKLLDLEELEMTLRFQQTDNQFLLFQGLQYNKYTLEKTLAEIKTK